MRIAALLAAVLLVACSPSSGASASDVVLTVEPEVIPAGDSVLLTLSNESPDSIGYNLCTSGVEERIDGNWLPVPSDRVCTMELRILVPGAQASNPLELKQGLAPGEYRFQTTIEWIETGEREEVWSQPFQIGS